MTLSDEESYIRDEQETSADQRITRSPEAASKLNNEPVLSENSKLLDPGEYQSELPSPRRQKVMLVVLLSLQFLALSIDTLIVPFFPTIAKTKGLNTIHTGVIFSGYEFVRFLTSPIYGSLVRTQDFSLKSNR